MIGIYKITTKHNGKIYVGSSDDIEKRIKMHISRLKRNVHHSIFLQNVFNKHGVTNLEFSIIEELLSSETKLEREQYWIDFYRCYEREYGYNLSKKVQLNTYCYKKIYQYNLEGNFIREWESLVEAEKTLNLTSISQALKQEIAKTCGNFQWRYFKVEKIESILKLYVCYNIQGNYVISFDFTKDIKNLLKINCLTPIHDSIKKNLPIQNYYIKIYNSYTFPKTIEITINPKKLLGKKIIQKDVEGNVIQIFNSVTEAAMFIKVDIGNLSRCISNKNKKYKTCKGFIWEYL